MYDIADGGTTNNGGIDFVEAGVDDFNPITDTQNPGPTININHIDSGSSSSVAFNNNNNIVYGYDSRINDVQNVNKCGSTGGLIDYQNSPKTVTMNFSGPLTFDPSIVGSSPTTMTDGFDIRGGVVVRGNRNSCDYDGYDYFEGLDYMNDWHHTPCYFSDCMDGGTWPFTITLTPQVATPIITPPTGTFTTAQSATISDSTSGATIYYTTNGTTPTTASPVYSKAFTVSSTTTVEAMAAASGYINSNVATSTITINVPPEQQVATPVITPPTGTFTTAQSATISDSTSGATIYYTTNGTTPTTASPVYSKAFTVSSTTTVEAMAAASGYINSNVATSTITINGTINVKADRNTSWVIQSTTKSLPGSGTAETYTNIPQDKYVMTDQNGNSPYGFTDAPTTVGLNDNSFFAHFFNKAYASSCTGWWTCILSSGGTVNYNLTSTTANVIVQASVNGTVAAVPSLVFTLNGPLNNYSYSSTPHSVYPIADSSGSIFTLSFPSSGTDNAGTVIDYTGTDANCNGTIISYPWTTLNPNPVCPAGGILTITAKYQERAGIQVR
jgi:hypothetical protein